MKRILLAILLPTLLLACKKDKEKDPAPEAGFISKGSGAFIVSEGNFQAGNGTIHFYNSVKNEISASLFPAVNNRPLGDVAQSVTIDGDHAYIIVNNSSKIEVVSLPDFKSKATITGMQSPRYMISVAPGKAYVSNYYSNVISVINTVNNSVSAEIPCYGWTDQMTRIGNKVYVVNVKFPRLYVLDITTDKLVDSIELGAPATGVVSDKNNMLWVSCSSVKSQSIYPALKQINPVSKSVLSNIALTNPDISPLNLTMNGSLDSLYFIYQDIYKLAINATDKGSAFITAGGKTFYGLGVDPVSREVYVSDAIDYVQKGLVLKYAPNGTLSHSFNAGIIPGFFCFY